MFCPQCGKKLEAGERFCPACGNRIVLVQEGMPSHNGPGKIGNDIKKFFSKPRNIIFSVAGALLLAVFTFTIVQAFTYSNLVKSKQYVSANKMYVSIASDNKLILSKLLIDLVTSRQVQATYNQYINEKISYEDANAVLNYPTASYPVKKQADEYAEAVDKLKVSRDAMKTAVTAENAKDYFLAIDNYKNVIPEDKKNYDNSKKAVERCTTELYTYYLQQASTLMNNGDYYNGIIMLRQVQKYYPDDSKLKSTIDQYTRTTKDKVITECDSLISQDDYEGAIQKADYARTFFNDDSEMQGKVDEYQQAKEEYEQRQAKLEYERQNPLTIITKSSNFDDYMESYKVTFTVENTSSFYVNSAQLRATILDSNYNEITSDYTYVYDIPAGQTKEGEFYVNCSTFYPYYRLEIFDIVD